MPAPVFKVVWNEDSSATVLGRVTARDGSGAATGVAGEGNWLQQANISAITCKVFDLSVSGSVPITTPTVTVSTVILDTPVTSQAIWTEDAIGYNFIHDLGPENFPTGSNRVRVEYKFTLTGGTVFHGIFEGPTRSVYGS